MSVDLPAPFSPSRACTSPGASSKSIASLATRLPKRLVIPRSSRAGWSAISRSPGGGPRRARPPGERLLDGVGRSDLARGDLRLDRLQLRDDGRRHVRADLADARAVILGGEEVRRAALERPGLDLLDRVVHGHVDLLDRARQDEVAEVGLVGVHADAPDALLLRGGEGPEPAAARNLEDDIRVLRDLVQRELLARRLV